MHNFTKEQYEGLENGGNRRAKKYFFAQLPEDFKYPEHEQKLQEFLRAVYVDKIYYRKEDAPKSNTGKKKLKAKAAMVGKIATAVKHEGEPRSPASSGSAAPLPPLASQKTGDSQISHLSQRSNGSVGSEDSDGADERGVDFLGESFSLTEVEAKAPTKDRPAQKTGSTPDTTSSILDDSLSGRSSGGHSLESTTGSSSRRNSRIAPTGGRQAAIEALVVQLSDVKDQFKLSEADFKSYVVEAVKIVLTQPPPTSSDDAEGNPFDDEEDEAPAPKPAAKPISFAPISAAKPAATSSSSIALFPDLDEPSSTPLPTLGPVSAPRPAPTYAIPSYTTTPMSSPPTYSTTPMPAYATHTLPGPAPTPAYYMTPGGQPIRGPPTGSYVMNGVGPTHPYGVMHPGAGGVLVLPAAPAAVAVAPEKPKVDLFAGLDPFAK